MRKQADVLYDDDDYMILIPKQRMPQHILVKQQTGVLHLVNLNIIINKVILLSYCEEKMARDGNFILKKINLWIHQIMK